MPQDFFARPATDVAPEMLGCVVVCERNGVLAAGRIVETEAYLGPEDPASHAARLRRGRVLAMAGPVGIAYVYRSHGLHAMLNVVAHAEGEVGAVLIRAVEPTAGVEAMRVRRGPVVDRLLCAGPGRLCQALGIRLEDHGEDLTDGSGVWLASGEMPAEITASGRIGVSRAGDVPWRFFEAGSRFVSGHRRGVRLARGGAVSPVARG